MVGDSNWVSGFFPTHTVFHPRTQGGSGVTFFSLILIPLRLFSGFGKEESERNPEGLVINTESRNRNVSLSAQSQSSGEERVPEFPLLTIPACSALYEAIIINSFQNGLPRTDTENKETWATHFAQKEPSPP